MSRPEIYHKLLTSTTDEERVDWYCQLAFTYRNEAPDSTLFFAGKALSMSEENGYRKGIADSYRLLGVYLFKISNYDSSRYYFNKSISLSRLGGFGKIEASSLVWIGESYFDQSRYYLALPYYEKALKVAEASGDSISASLCYNGIASIYMVNAEYDNALNLFEKSINLSKQIPYLNNVASCKVSVAKIFSLLGKYDEAISSYYEAAKLCEEIKNINLKGVCYYGLGIVYSEMKNYHSSISALDSALAIFRGTNFRARNADAQVLRASVLLALAEAATALSIADSALNLAIELNYLGPQAEAYRIKYQVFKFKNQPQLALANLERYFRVNNEKNNAAASKSLAELEFKVNYEFQARLAKARTEKELAQKQLKIRRKKLGSIAAATFSFMGLLLGLIFFRNAKQQKKAGVRLDHLNQSIQQTSRELEVETQKADNLLLNILPYQTAFELKTRGKARSNFFPRATVMFVCIENLLEASNQMTANEFVSSINHCIKKFESILDHYGLEKIKTIGNVFICAGGINDNVVDDMPKVIQAGRDMIEYFKEEYIQDRQGDFKGFRVRIGVHCGPVIAGVVGTKKYAYDIWGDTVNTAARMEQNSDVWKLNISGAVYENVKNEFNCIYRGKVSAKNKGEIDMYFVE